MTEEEMLQVTLHQEIFQKCILRILRSMDDMYRYFQEEIYGNRSKSKYPQIVTEAVHSFMDAHDDLDWIWANMDGENLDEDELIRTDDEYRKAFDNVEKDLEETVAYTEAYLIRHSDDNMATYIAGSAANILDDLKRVLNEDDREEKVG